MTQISPHAILEINGVPWINIPEKDREKITNRIDKLQELEKEIGGEYIGSCFGVMEFEVRPAYNENDVVEYDESKVSTLAEIRRMIRTPVVIKQASLDTAFRPDFYIFVYPHMSKRFFKGAVSSPAAKDRLVRTHGIKLTDDNFIMWSSLARQEDFSYSNKERLENLKRIIVIQEDGESDQSSQMTYDKACKLYDYFSPKSKDVVGITFVEITKNGDLK